MNQFKEPRREHRYQDGERPNTPVRPKRSKLDKFTRIVSLFSTPIIMVFSFIARLFFRILIFVVIMGFLAFVIKEVPHLIKLATVEPQEYRTEVLDNPVTFSIDDIAKEVLEGKWGVGDDIKKNLENAGFNYDRVEDAINKLEE